MGDISPSTTAHGEDGAERKLAEEKAESAMNSVQVRARTDAPGGILGYCVLEAIEI